MNQVDINEDALKKILKETQGYPYFIQEWGKHSWDVAKKSPITNAEFNFEVQHGYVKENGLLADTINPFNGQPWSNHGKRVSTRNPRTKVHDSGNAQYGQHHAGDRRGTWSIGLDDKP